MHIIVTEDEVKLIRYALTVAADALLEESHFPTQSATNKADDLFKLSDRLREQTEV